jgi:hypothetical protein
VSIDGGVAIAADNRTVTIKFIGGPLLASTHPCYSEYKGWARLAGQHLDLAVATVRDGRPDHGTGCPAAGFERTVEVVLDSPFVGTTATDLSDGKVLEIQRSPTAARPGADGLE